MNFRLGGVKDDNLELSKNRKEPSIALANNEKRLNLYAKRNYHIQGLNQSKWGFWLSVVGAVLGFIIIVSSLIFNNEVKMGTICGGIIEAVSALFFSISNKANERVLKSFDKLRIDSNTVNAIELAKTVEDVHARDELKVKLSLHLIGINEKYICKNSKDICKKLTECE